MTKKDDKKKETYLWGWLYLFGTKNKPDKWWK